MRKELFWSGEDLGSWSRLRVLGKRVTASLGMVKLYLLGKGRKETLRKAIAEKTRKVIPLYLEKCNSVTMNSRESITIRVSWSLLESG